MSMPQAAHDEAANGKQTGGQLARRFSLRARVAMLAAICVAAAVALVSVGAYFTVQRNLYAEINETLKQRAQAAVQSPPVSTRLKQIPGAFLATTDIRIGLLDADGELVYPPNGHPPPVGHQELAVARGQLSHSLRTDQETDTRVIALPSGPGQAMVLAQSLKPTQRTLSELALVLTLIGASGVILAAVAGLAVARTGLRPVSKLTSATERVARTGNLQPIPISGDDELARLTHSFNAMLAAVAESQAAQRQLVADAGHELRTPLTSMRTNLELLLAASKSQTQRLSDSDRLELEEDIRLQLDELTQLIGDLVELARQDEPRSEAERVDVVDVIGRALDRARRRAGEVSFDTQLSPWVLTGDPNALERAVLNLLDNAVKFSPAGAVVRVRLYPLGDGTAVIEVSDSGPGIVAEDLPKVFDRFYRSSEARTMPGSGLGLAIVKQAAQRHGGAVYASSSAEGGALITIRLPGAGG